MPHGPKVQRFDTVPLALIFVTTILYSLTMHSFSIFFQSSVYLEIVPAELILNGFEWLSQAIVPGVTRQTALNIVAGALETLAIYSVFIVLIFNHFSSKKQRGDSAEQ